jgi:4-amino-4-deoxy-L-arabinose transferase-like glycosyltransferase
LSQKLAAAALVAVAIVLHGWNLGGGTLDAWDEALSAERAREMMEARSWVTPLLDGRPDWNKPPLYYWLVIAGYRAFGVGELAVRLPSALFGLACAALVYAIGCRITGTRAGGLVAAALLVANPHWLETTREGLLDSGFTAAMLAGGWLLCSPASSVRRALAGGALIGLGAALKNPLALLAFALPLGSCHGDRPPDKSASDRVVGGVCPRCKLGVAFGAFAVVGGAWYAVETWRFGGAFLDFYVGYNIWERATVGIDGHRTDLLLYARRWPELTPATFAAFVLPLAWAIARDRQTLRRVAPLLAFVAAWLVVIHAGASKRTIYLAPLHPFVAAASAPLALAMLGAIRSTPARRALAAAFGAAALAVLAARYDPRLDFSPDWAAAARDVARRADPADAFVAIQTPRHLLAFYARREVHAMQASEWVPGARSSWVVAPAPVAEALRERALARDPARRVDVDCASDRACVVAVGGRERE